MDIDSINSETVNIHYTAHQFWEQKGPRTLLMDVANKLSFNPEGYCKLPSNAGGKLSAKQQNFFNKRKDIETELSFVDSMFEMWKLRWLIIQSKDELLHTEVLKEYRHQDGTYIFDRA